MSFVFVCSGNAGAQSAVSPPNLNLGDVIVTGFSGTLAPDPDKPIPRNKSVIDLTFIDPNGASAEIVDVSRPGKAWDAGLLSAPKKFRVTAAQVGQVFGVAIGDQPRPDVSPNIYLGATSVFGLQIVHRGSNGVVERLKSGAPGAQWAEGQFGLGLQGGPGAIYVVDGATGAVTLLANVMLDGVPNPGPGLGNLAYDSVHKQLFVSDIYTGMIHRVGLDGADLGHLDHGATVRPAAQLPAAPFDPRRRLNIASNSFDANNPDSWNMAPAARQVWAVTVYQQRLYYSVLEGPQIWSVGIQPNGDFASDARLEVDIPVQQTPLAVTDIAFSPQGAMVVAQRNAFGASFYDYSAFTKPGEPRVLRFWLKKPADPPSPGLWIPTPEEIPVGFAGNGRNSNGGVAFGYGYDQSQALSTNACGATLLISGEKLRLAPSLRDQLAPGGPLSVDGVQITPSDIVRDANAPQPWTSYFVDYDDKFPDSATTAGSQGSVRTFAAPCAPPQTLAGGSAGAVAPPIVGGASGGGGGGGGGGCDRPDCGPTGKLIVLKEVVNKTRGNVTGYVYPVVVHCSGQPDQNLTLHFPNQIPVQTISNIPQGATCSVTENTGGLPVPPNACPIGNGTVPVWTTSISPASVTIGGSPQTITVTNTLICERIKPDQGTLIVVKKVDNKAPKPIPTTTTYPINVNCGGSITNMVLSNGGSQQVTNIPYTTSCTVNEPPPPLPNVCPPRTTPQWTTSYVSTNTVVINTPTTTVTVLNTLTCVPIDKVCTPPLVLNAAGECVCPPPMLPGAVPGQCICPQGSQMVGGKCVPIDKTCLPPLVMNAAGECVSVVRSCKPPLVMNAAGECVRKPIACPANMSPNASGRACVCEPGLVRYKGTCREHAPHKQRAKATPRHQHPVCEPPARLNRRGVCVQSQQGPVQPWVTPGGIPRGIPGGGGGGPVGPRGGGGAGGRP
ncbi:MAG: DUF5979 domain-containing protein [Beijerinckiaceae bacterium]|jgi:hypothetical protein